MACPRLVEWRVEAAANPRRRYAGQEYWAKPLTGFGDPDAELVIVGLAPAAHGGNRTGRMFTGDRSGDFLFAALHRAGYANQPLSQSLDDGLQLRGAYMTAAVRCAPPANRPSTSERDTCLPYLAEELSLLKARVWLCLGGFAYDTLQRVQVFGEAMRPRRRFSHGLEVGIELDGQPGTVICSFHPSQQNVFTGRLTAAMLDAVLARTKELVKLR